MTEGLRDALNAVVTTMTWKGGTGVVHDAEAWRTLVGRIVMATNGDNDGQVPMGATPVAEGDEARRLLGYLWTDVSDLFAEDDPIVADVERLAIFPMERCANCGLTSIRIGPPCPRCGSKTVTAGEVDLMSAANRKLLGRIT